MQKVLFLVISFVVVCTGIYIAQGECQQNEEYLLCGSACAFNCTNPTGPVVCTDECVEGCFCKSGFLRNDSGICVDADLCKGNDTVCGRNEEFVPCQGVCPRTCPQPEPLDCGLTCSMGCFCKAGFYRDIISNECVAPQNCPVEQCIMKNEVFDVCKAACQPSCEDSTPICTKECKAGCVCATGFLRNKNGECIPADKCFNHAIRETKTQIASPKFRKYIETINRLLQI